MRRGAGAAFEPLLRFQLCIDLPLMPASPLVSWQTPPVADTSTNYAVEGEDRSGLRWDRASQAYVIEKPALAVQQCAQKQVIRYLHNVFRNEVRHAPSNLLPPYVKERLKEVITK